VYALALEVAAEVIDLVRSVPPQFKAVGDQATRSAPSLLLNLAEGSGRVGRDRLNRYRVAYAEALETTACMQLMAAAQVVDTQRAVAVLAKLDRVQAMTWRLIHPRQ